MGRPDTTEVDEIALALFTPEGRRDPYPVYRRLQERGPVHRSSLGWLVTDYAVCNRVLRDPRLVTATGRPGSGRPDPAEHPSLALLYRTMLMSDPPDHTRLRRLVSKAFTPRTVAALQPAIGSLLDTLLAGITQRAADGATVDLMTELAFPFPVAVIGQMVGVPAADQAQFQSLVRDLTLAVELTADEASLAVADAAALEVTAYFEGLVAQRRRQPGDDLTSALVAVEEAGDRLNSDELIATLALLFLAGFETTTNLIGNGLLALLRHPDQLAALRRDLSSVVSATEELLRFDPPVQLLMRVAAEGLTLDEGVEIGPGRSVVLMLGAANRDPRVFTEPERLRLDRAEGAPISFGGGIHYCLGAGLARLEARLLLTELLTRFPAIELVGEPRYRDGLSVHGLTELPLRLVPAGSAAMPALA